MFREVKESKASPSWFMNQDLNPEPSASKESITNFPLYPDFLAKLPHAGRSGRGTIKTQRQFEGI